MSDFLKTLAPSVFARGTPNSKYASRLRIALEVQDVNISPELRLNVAPPQASEARCFDPRSGLVHPCAYLSCDSRH